MDQIMDDLLMNFFFSFSVIGKENIWFYGYKSDLSVLNNVSGTVPWLDLNVLWWLGFE